MGSGNFNLNANVILQNFGGSNANNIIDIFQLNDIDNIIQVKKSLYYDIDSLINFLKTHSTELTILSLNIQSLNSKFSQLQSLLKILSDHSCFFSVICFQESWLSTNDNYGLYKLDGYKMFKKDFEIKLSKHGGLVTFIKENIEVDNFKVLNKNNTYEGLLTKICLNNKQKLAILNVYRPPRNNNSNFQDFFLEFIPKLNGLLLSNKEMVIVGDFNINLVQSSNNKNITDYLDHMFNLELFPLITYPTHFINTSASLLDHIFCKFSQLSLSGQSGILLSDLSDHCPTFLSLNTKPYHTNTHPKYIKTSSFTKESEILFKQDLETINFSDILDTNPLSDPNVNYNILLDVLTNLKNKYSYETKVRFNKYKHKLNEWITPGILSSIHIRDKLYKKVRNFNTNHHSYLEYKGYLQRYNKILKKVIVNAKIFYYQRIFENCKQDIKKTWDNIKTLINDSFQSNHIYPKFIITNANKCITNKLEIANRFNEFFTNIGPSYASKIDTDGKPPFESFLQHKPLCEFTFQNVNIETVSQILRTLKPKSSCGFDGINSKLLKCCHYALLQPLTLIINQSLNTGTFPDKLKTAKVIPIYKGKDLNINDLNSYRPISILPVISKIFEKVVYQQVYHYLSTNNLLSNSQYGFRKNHSTELASIELIDRVFAYLDSGKQPIAVFCDLSKAFDTLDYNIMLKKLQFYGFNARTLNWFSSYFSNRQQFVLLDNSSSSLCHITTGVPQGSILGPLLFLIYVNDLTTSTDSNIIMYADDACLLIPLTVNTTKTHSLSETNTQTNEINNKFLLLYNWLCVNKLSLNISKTKFMLFHYTQKHIKNKHIPKISINNNNIERVSSFKFLGINIDESLTWITHIQEVSNKISKINYILSVLKHYLPTNILHTIYNSLLLPHLYYGVTLWGFGDYTRLEILQKKAIRNINKSPNKSHSLPIAFKLKTLLLEDLFKLSCFKFFYKYKNKSLPSYFAVNKFIQLTSITRHSLRHSNPPLRFADYISNIPITQPTLPIPISNKKTTNKCLRFAIPHLINTNYLPFRAISKIDTHSFYSFVQYCKKIIIDKYNIICSIPNCYVCQN